jgi:hypothetical protein
MMEAILPRPLEHPMRFLIFRKADPDTEAGKMPTQALIDAMGAYIGEMAAAGVLLGGEGLKPTTAGVRVKFRRGQPTLTDGPFTETKELVAGYTLIDVPSKEAALDWLRRWPVLDGDGEVELELRQVYEMADFGMDDSPALSVLEARPREAG